MFEEEEEKPSRYDKDLSLAAKKAWDFFPYKRGSQSWELVPVFLARIPRGNTKRHFQVTGVSASSGSRVSLSFYKSGHFSPPYESPSTGHSGNPNEIDKFG